MKKIVFCDIDGTLIDGFNGILDVSKRNSDAIRKLKDSCCFVLCSGRAKFMLNKSILDLGADGYILSNGAYIEYNGHIIKSTSFTSDEVKLLEDFNKTSGSYHLLVNQKGYYSPYANKKLVNDLLLNLGIDTKYQLAYKDNEVHYMIEIAHNEKEASNFVNNMHDKYKISRHYKYISFDVNQKNDNKGAAIKLLLNNTEYQEIETYAIGDSDNDLDMMKLVDHPIAMGNATKAIKDVAEYVSTSIEQDGVCQALEYFKLI